ncbi:MAG: hypothetical protein FWD54_05445 [Endomicrobia bacterium]|nr:hypothetical protein [Endomicrobiia bacterium]MCL2799697.1 hypothetical protein [Endomicrobiia bacterium]
MKKILTLLFLLLFAGLSFGEGERYILFFAESSDISQNVIDRILSSRRFCISVPVNPSEKLPENLEELAFWGKVEPALSFDPEPVLPVLATVYSNGISKSGKNSAFGDYIVNNISSFEENINREQFGIFLNSGVVSHNLLYYFSGLSLPWINVSNAQPKFNGVYNIYGINSFSLHTDFPSDVKKVMKWLESKKNQSVIPVLLSKKHLNNYELISYLADMFDKSKYIKPAVPIFITTLKKDLIAVNNSVSFEQISVKSGIMSKLYAAASLINDYKDSKKFTDYSYKGAQSELVYLCSSDLLKGVAQNKLTSVRMFDAAYSNISRLLGLQESLSDKEKVIQTQQSAEKSGLYSASDETFRTNVTEIPDGISITNSGILSEADIISKDGSIKVSMVFGDDAWNAKTEYVDMYIDMNNIEGAGSTSMLSGTKGFLTPDSGWEYALRIFPDKAMLYRHTNDGPSLIAEIPVNDSSFLISQKYIRGNPVNWGFQFISVSRSKEIIDFLNQTSQSDASILAIKPFQIHAVRLKK